MARWTDYFLEKDFSSFWARRVEQRNTRVLVILGIGFDPRCLVSLEAMAALGLGDRLGCFALKLIARPALGKSGEITETLTKTNADALVRIDACAAKTCIFMTERDTTCPAGELLT